MAREYGVTDVDFQPLAAISAYTLLDQKKVLAAGIFSTDPPLASGGVRRPEGPEERLRGSSTSAPIVSRKLTQENPELMRTLNGVSEATTLEAMIALNKAVAIDKRSPAKVADAFLKANKLMAEPMRPPRPGAAAASPAVERRGVPPGQTKEGPMRFPWRR